MLVHAQTQSANGDAAESEHKIVCAVKWNGFRQNRIGRAERQLPERNRFGHLRKINLQIACPDPKKRHCETVAPCACDVAIGKTARSDLVTYPAIGQMFPKREICDCSGGGFKVQCQFVVWQMRGRSCLRANMGLSRHFSIEPISKVLALSC